MTIDKAVSDFYAEKPVLPGTHMHIGGAAAARGLIAAMGLTPGQNVLDAGCGPGAVAQLLHEMAGCTVTGIDLNPVYINTARASGVGRFDVGSVLDMPYEAAEFDAAITMHVAMNIADKAAFYAELARVIRPGGGLGVYDIMAGAGIDDMKYPLPWCDDARGNFLETPDRVCTLLEGCGFDMVRFTDCTEDAFSALQKLLSGDVAAAGRGPDFAVRIANLSDAIANQYCRVGQVLAVRSGAGY